MEFNKNYDNNFTTPLKIVYSNKITVDNNWIPNLHKHPHTELFYVIEGAGKLILSDEEVTLNSNDFIIINSNLKHTESNNLFKEKKDNLQYIVVGVEGLTIKDFSSEKNKIYDFTKSYVFKKSFPNKDNKIYRLIRAIYDEFSVEKAYYKYYADNLLKLLIIDMLRLEDENIIIENDLKKDKQIEFIKNYIDSHFSMEFTLDDLSKLAYINKYYMIHQFKNLYKITPIEYMIKKRIESAMDLLENTNYSMQEISSIVGFNSQAYFNQSFKKRIGTTPGKYRQRIRSNSIS